jgi:plastocyanin
MRANTRPRSRRTSVSAGNHVAATRLYLAGINHGSMGRALFLLAIAALGSAAPLAAAPLTVRVTDPSGKPVANAVVTLHPAAGAARPMPVGKAYTVSQKDLQFHPFVLVVPAGATVSFPNLDPTKHHVYSFSAAKRFELKLFAREQSRSVRFDKPGMVALGCNIHDAMSAFIVVADSAWTARTDAQGRVHFADAPTAAGTVSVWHPYLRAPGGTMSRAVGPKESNASFSVRLRPPPMHGSGY